MGALYYIPARRFPDGRVPDTVKSRRTLIAEAVRQGDASLGLNGLSLDSIGLGHLDGAVLTYRAVRNQGPDGGAGLVIGLRVPTGDTGIFKDRQTWHPCNGGDLFFGWTDAQPGPDTFLRDRALSASVSVPLGDGNRWGFIATAALPERAVFDASGQPTWAPRAEDAAHYEASKWLMNYATVQEPQPYFDIIDRVAVCLAARYHVSKLEMLALGLFSTELNAPIVYACLGIDLAEDEEKKSEV